MLESSRLHALATGVNLDPLAETYTVLHVDDDSDFAELTATFLETESDAMNVVVETSADDGLSRLADESIDCIVSDYQMPGADGIEFLEAVRKEHPDLPFILFTGQGSEEVAGRAISAGVTDYLQKENGTEQYTVLANRVENAVEQFRTTETIEQLLRAIESAREGISLLNEDGRFVYLNEAYADTYGYNRETLLGEHWERLYPAEEAERVREEILPNIPEGDVWSGETTQVRADSTKIRTDHALAYTDPGLMVCNIRAPASETAVSSGLSPKALDALDDLLFVFSEEGTLQYWNEQVEAITGRAADDLSSLTPAEFVREKDAERMEQYIQETREEGEARIEAHILTADNETIPYEFISKRVTDATGDVIGRIGLGRDITDQKRYEARIEQQNQRLEHFAEVLSHDLRNPLSVAKGRLELLHETGDDQQYEHARRALARMDSLITDVLTLAQTGEQISLDEYESVELATLAEEAWSLIRADEATLTIEDSASLEADTSRLQQVFENLFRNAVEHVGDGVSVRVGLLPDGSGIYVEDDGPGIPPAERDRVFEPGHSTKPDGTGFGLTTVTQIIEAHGWAIQISKSAAGGARFELSGVEIATRDTREHTGEE